MKKIFVSSLLLLLLFGCKTTNKKATNDKANQDQAASQQDMGDEDTSTKTSYDIMVNDEPQTLELVRGGMMDSKTTADFTVSVGIQDDTKLVLLSTDAGQNGTPAVQSGSVTEAGLTDLVTSLADDTLTPDSVMTELGSSMLGIADGMYPTFHVMADGDGEDMYALTGLKEFNLEDLKAPLKEAYDGMGEKTPASFFQALASALSSATPSVEHTISGTLDLTNLETKFGPMDETMTDENASSDETMTDSDNGTADESTTEGSEDTEEAPTTEEAPAE